MKRLSLFVSLFILASVAFASDPVPLQPVEATKSFQYPFKGQWLPAAQSLYVGADNYTVLQNLRYTDASLETIEGYSKITSTPMSQTPVSGFHFNKPNVSEVITKAYTGSYYNLYRNSTAIPGTGDYNASPINTDTFYVTYLDLDSSPGWFTNAPSGLMFYADSGTGAHLYGSDGVDPTILFMSLDAVLPITDYNDVTEESNNSADNFTYNSATQSYLYIGSPWLITDIAVDVHTANVSASTLTMTIWDGTAWTAKTITDGTSSGGIALAQDGTIELAYNSVAPNVSVINGQQLYWYRLSLSAGSAILNSIKLRVPFQPPKDIWNGSGRTCIGFHVKRDGEWEDYTYQVATKSTKEAAFAATVGGLDGSDEIDLVFEEPIQAIKIKMLEGLTNKKAATISYIYYWDGDSYPSVSGILDETLDSGSTKTLNQSGIISWSAYSLSAKPHEVFGVYGYHYRIILSSDITDAQKTITGTDISFTAASSTIAKSGSPYFNDFEAGDTIIIIGSSSNNGTHTISTVSPSAIVVAGTLSDESAGASVTIKSYDLVDHDGTSIDTVEGVTAPLTMTGYNGVGQYAGRVMLIDGNRVDYSLPNYPWIYNGVNTSNRGAPNPLSLYFGDESAITATHSLSNRYGSNIIESWVVTKNNETYSLTGSQPYMDYGEPFVIRRMSSSIGCSAPMTMKEVQITLEGIQRNGLMWLDSSGPVIFDGAIINPVGGIENYFDPTETEYIKTSIIEKSTAYYDSTHSEYNLMFPSGSSATANNVWLVYDLKHRKWYKKVPASYPIYTTNVEDTDGVKYGYGHLSSGHLMRLDNTQAWDGSGIAQMIRTGSFIPPVTGEHGVFDFSELINLKLVSNAISEDADVTSKIYGDGSVAAQTQTIALNSGGDISRNKKDVNQFRLKKYTYQAEFSTTTSTNKWEPLFWGYKARYLRED